MADSNPLNDFNILLNQPAIGFQSSWHSNYKNPLAQLLLPTEKGLEKLILKNATPDIPDKKNDAANTINNDVKIATSNIYMSNQPQVQIDEITRILFSNISSKDLISLTTGAGAWNQYQVPSSNANLTNSFEVSQAYNSSTIISLAVPLNKASNVINGSSSAIPTSSTQATITTPYVSSYVKAQIQTITVGKIQTGTKYP